MTRRAARCAGSATKAATTASLSMASKEQARTPRPRPKNCWPTSWHARSGIRRSQKKNEGGRDADVSPGTDSNPEADAGTADESGGKNASSNAEGATGIANEAVGPEIQPVGGTEDSTDNSDQPNMLERFKQRIGAGIEKAVEEPIGLDPEDIQALREAGVFRTGDEGRIDLMATIRAFNEILIGGGGAALDLSGRFVQALSNALAAAIAQAAQELGESQGMSRRLERDVNLLLNLAAIFLPTRGPSGPRRPTGKVGGRRISGKADAVEGETSKKPVATAGEETQAIGPATGATKPQRPSAVAKGEDRYVLVGNREFVRHVDGSLDFGTIPPEIAQKIGREPAPIRLPRGRTRHEGEQHLERGGKLDEIHRAGYEDAANLVDDVGRNFSEIWLGKGDTLLLVKRGTDPLSPMIYVELRKPATGAFYEVNSGGIWRDEYPSEGGRVLLWRGERTSTTATGKQEP